MTNPTTQQAVEKTKERIKEIVLKAQQQFLGSHEYGEEGDGTDEAVSALSSLIDGIGIGYNGLIEEVQTGRVKINKKK